jgi:SAM-dependent methyltransferase
VDSRLLGLLVDPIEKAPLELHDPVEAGGDVTAGSLVARNGQIYPIERGIPRFVDKAADEGQDQTRESFGFKWKQRDAYESPKLHDWQRQWVVGRYGFSSADEMRSFFAGQERILDAGCGSGFTTALWMEPGWRDGGSADWVGADISEAIDVARDRLGDREGVSFVQADVLKLPFAEGTFTAAFSEGVLHHTPSTQAALASLASVLAPGGEALFYVYRRKGPIREYADDFIREVVSPLPPEEALEVLRPLTKLGGDLAALGATVTVSEDIPLLGIEAGTYDVQRLVYWHFLKLFWNEELSLDENNLVNFDWYHPRYAHRQSEEELRSWCEAAGLSIMHLDAQESGFTVRAVKR